MESQKWSVLLVNLALEQRAETRLRELGHATFFPRHRERIYRRGRRMWRLSMLFPGYGFLGLPVDLRAIVDRVEGIWGWVREADGEAATVGDRVIRELRGRLGPQGWATLPLAERFALGAMVRFKTRSLVDLCGFYAGRSAHAGRVIVEYDLLGRRVPVEVQEGELVAA